jgi:hypothetical protein
MTTKIEPTNNSQLLTYFTKHLTDMIKKPSQKDHKILEKLKPLIQRLKNKTNFHVQSTSQNQKQPTDKKLKQLSKRASTDEEVLVLQVATKATRVSNPERTGTKIPSVDSWPRAENRSGKRKNKTGT